MTLEQKYKKATSEWFDTFQCEKIADQYAISFVEFITNKCFYEIILCKYIYNEESYTIDELLIIYKKESKL